MSFFKTQVSFPLNFASLFIVMTDNSFKNFLAEALCALDKRPIKVQFVKLLSALMKVYPTSHAILDTSRSGFIQILHHSSLSWKMTSLYFLAEPWYTLDMKVNFSDFWLIGWKFTKFMMTSLKQYVSFSLNFALFFNVMRNSSSVLF